MLLITYQLLVIKTLFLNGTFLIVSNHTLILNYLIIFSLTKKSVISTIYITHQLQIIWSLNFLIKRLSLSLKH